MLKELEVKQMLMIHCVKGDIHIPTFISITGARALTIVHSVFSVLSVMAGFDCRDAFHVVLCL